MIKTERVGGKEEKEREGGNCEIRKEVECERV